MQKVKIEITLLSILKIALVGIALYLLVELQSIIVIVLISYIFIAALSPIIDWLVKKKVNRGVAVAIVYLTLIMLIGLLIFSISKPLIDVSTDLIKDFPNILEKLKKQYPFLNDVIRPEFADLGRLLNDTIGRFGDQSARALNAIFRVFGALTTVLTVIVISVYGMLDKESLLNKIFYFTSKSKKAETQKLLEKVELQVGAWARGQLALMFVIGLLNFIMLHLIGLGEYALPIAVLSGLLELLPIIGPIVAGVIVTIIGLSISPIIAILGAVGATVIQLLENHLIVPTIMKKAVGLDPVFTIIAILVGSQLLGIVGAILSVPFTAVFTSIFLHFYEKREIKETKEIEETEKAA